ncbi:related to FAD-dependent oxidoreductase [Ramularia collo-cygni]|uniref:Related to FAD-dependent oxidoreductase n=1 Tax=Ramularia collo-cygni TaxID=112498 RepID=A0A2D3UT13_9PEZI|nr:related to FAD-dependent oxidoreductase [Ramularia collo-cygni]CZT15890.1 related to FAD-dependent oxidoreductase [Ramularia collo-cygni]
MISKDSPIAIAGSGAWGLSTALHLLNAGYTNITVFDRAETIPSPYSAANDLNKIVRPEYEDPFYTNLALQAIKAWQTPLFGPYYHHTGYVVAATGSAPVKAVEHLEAALSSIQSHPELSPGIRRLDSPEDFKTYTWQYSGPLTGFKGYFNPTAGYAHSADALHGIWLHCASRGVRFILGDSIGKVSAIIYSGSRATGLVTADGRRHLADLVIVALGAHAASLIPSVGKFATARAWSVAHIQLSPSETNFLRGIPTTNIRDLGFFFEPDPATNLFKLCPLGVGYTNTSPSTGISLPPMDILPPPQDFIPWEDEVKLRRLLRETFPWMADRPFVDKKLCWFSDTEDSDYLVDFVPDTESSVICLSGDSGHGFKMMPVFGEWVVDLIRKGKQNEGRWKWKNVDLTGKNWGEGVSWRIGKGSELKELLAAKDKLVKARL